MEETEQEKIDNENMIKQMHSDIAEKEKKLKGVIDDLTRKSNLNEKELLFLKN